MRCVRGFSNISKRGLSGRAAALRLKVSPATGSRWARAIRMRGHADSARQGRPPGKGKLAPYQAFFEELVAQDPDITLFELRDALAAAEGVEVHHSSIAALLSRLGFTYKKNPDYAPCSAACVWVHIVNIQPFKVGSGDGAQTGFSSRKG